MLTRREFLGSAVMLAAHGVLAPRLSWAADKPAKSGGAELIRIGFFTDIHTKVDRDARTALDAAAKAIKAADPQILIGGGDFIGEGYDSTSAEVVAKWDLFNLFRTELGLPFYSVIGNHDLVGARPKDGSPPAADPRSEYLDFFKLKSTYRSVDRSGYHLIMLDSVQIESPPQKFSGKVDAKQIVWLQEDLSRVPKDRPIILITHMPLLSSFYQATKGGLAAAPANQIVSNNRQILEQFKNHNLLLVLQGHLHVNEILQWRGTTFITGGAICGGWWRGDFEGTSEGFGMITIDKGRVAWDYRGYGWHAGETKPLDPSAYE